MIKQFSTLRGLLVLCVSLCISIGQAQKIEDISLTEVMDISHPTYPESDACYMVKNVKINYELGSDRVTMNSSYFERIKIYTNEGVQRFGNFKKYLGKGKSSAKSVQLRNLKVEVYNYEGDKVTTSKLSKKNIFQETYSDDLDQVIAALPNVKVGSIIELKYDIITPYIYATTRHDFQEDIPVEYSKYEIVKPDIIALTPIATGTIPWESENREKSSTNETITTYIARDVPPLLDDDYVLNIQDYRSSIKYEIHSVSIPGYPQQKYSEDWENLGQQLLKNDNLGVYLNDNVKDAKPLIEEALLLSEQDRIQYIYRYITDNFAYNKQTGIYADHKPTKIWEAKSGSVADLNILLINLLRKANVVAYPLVTKTRYSGILNAFYPSLTSLDYIIAVARVGDTYVMLDASSKYTKVGDLPIRALNFSGLLLSEPSKIIQIVNNNKQTIKEVAQLSIDLEDIALIGTGTRNLNGYAATKYRVDQDEEENEEDKQALAKDNTSDDEEGKEEDEEEVVDLREDVLLYTELIGLENKDSDIKAKFATNMYSCIKSIGSDIFLNAFVQAKFNENPFKEEKREFPAFFNTAHDLTFIYMIDVPEGYFIKEVPSDLIMQTEGGKASFLYVASQAGAKVSVRVQLKISDTIFLPEEYDILRRFFNAIMDKQKEKITLSKV